MSEPARHLYTQSRRDCASKPSAARNELPWESSQKIYNPNGVAPLAVAVESGNAQNHALASWSAAFPCRFFHHPKTLDSSITHYPSLRPRNRNRKMERGSITTTRTKSAPQSQRDCATKPRVARNELPWVNAQRSHQPQRGCGTARRQRLNPRWGCRHSTGYTDHVRAEPVMWTAPGVSEYRGFPIRLPGEPRWPCRLEAGDTAGWQPALLGLHLQLSCSRAQRYSLPSISIHAQKEI